MANGFTTVIGILLLVGIVLIVRYILKHGSKKASSCNGNCGSCGMGCMSAYSSERAQFEESMKERREKQMY